MLLALDRLLVYRRVRDALALAGWYVLQSLTGTYLMVFTAISIVAATLARPRDWLGARFAVRGAEGRARGRGRDRCADALPAAVLAASREVGLGRSLEETARYSAELTDYLAAAGTFHFERGADGSGRARRCSRA